MFLDSPDSLRLTSYGYYEPLETRLVESRIRPGSVVIDVGAHIGYYTLILARLVGSGGRVFAFEPDPDNFDLLRRNVELNGYGNVSLSRAALSDRTGTLELYLCEDNLADHRTYRPPNEVREAIAVESYRLDDCLSDLADRVAFVKIDIQGFEWRALEGMEQVLRRSRCLVMTEFWPLGLTHAGCEPRAYLDRLVELGFELCEIDRETARLIPCDRSELLAKYTPENGSFTNLVCEKVPR